MKFQSCDVIGLKKIPKVEGLGFKSKRKSTGKIRPFIVRLYNRRNAQSNMGFSIREI
jgi:hypothetical protein